jgi:hypothetical protein
MDDRGLRTERHKDKDLNINKIEDTMLMAYLLDPLVCGEARSAMGNYWLAKQRDDGFVFAGCLGRRYGAFSRSREPCPDRSLVQRGATTSCHLWCE